jgi:hypothetical protein
VTISFGEAVAEFGAYWGAATSVHVGDPALINVTFFSQTGELIGADVFSYSRPHDGLLEWHGWRSSVPIKSVTYTEDVVAIDALQANLVPEPSNLCLLGTAVTGLVIRRRR